MNTMRPYLLLLLSLLFFPRMVCAGEYWGENLQWNGRSITATMSEQPYMEQTYLNVDQVVVTGRELQVNFSLTLRWYNFQRRAATSAFLRTAVYRSFQYSYRIGVAKSAWGEVYKWLYESGEQTLSGFDSPVPNMAPRNFAYSSCENRCTLTQTAPVDVSALSLNQRYYVVVEFRVKPKEIWDERVNDYTEQGRVWLQENSLYTQQQVATIRKNRTGSEVFFRRETLTQPVIHVDETENPRYVTGVYERSLVYNHPDAVVSVQLDTAALPATKYVQDQRVYNFTACVAALEKNPSPETYTFAYPSNGCWSKYCDNGIQQAYIQYMNDAPDEKNFSKTLGNSNFYRYRNTYLVECSRKDRTYDKAILSMVGDGLVDASGHSTQSNPALWVHWRYALRDILPQAGSASVAGKLIYLQNVNMYLNQAQRAMLESDKTQTYLGYEAYGPNLFYPLYSTAAAGDKYPKSKNILTYEVVPPPVFPALTEGEQVLQRQCVQLTDTEQETAVHDLLLLKGKELDTGIYSSSVYAPEYRWEISVDGISWLDMKRSSFATYIRQPQDYPFGLAYNETCDLLVYSGILKAYPQVYFRQTAVLHTFSNAQHSELYRFKGDDGLYYIQEKATNYYSFAAYPSLRPGNMQLFGFPEKQEVCAGSEPAWNRVQFDLQPTEQVSEAEIQLLKQIADYKVYRCLDDAADSKELLSRGFTNYTLDYTGDSLHLALVIATCHDSLRKDVYIYPQPPVAFSFREMESSVTVAKADSAQGQVVLLALQGTEVRVRLNEADRKRSRYYWRAQNGGSWRPFDREDECVLPFTEGSSEAVFYWYKEDLYSNCVSDMVQVQVKYFSGIQHNQIAFAKASDIDKTTCYVFAGEGNPAISGFTVSGGYGVPDETVNDYSYLYRWIYRSPGGVWQKLSDFSDNGKGSATPSRVSLSANKIQIDRDLEFARVVISRIHQETLTQVSDTSNILRVNVDSPISQDAVTVYDGDGCAGSLITVVVEEFGEACAHSSYRWKSSDSKVQLTTNGNRMEECVCSNTKHDFVLTVCRYDSLSKRTCPPLEIPITLKTVQPDFTISVDGVEKDILSLPDEIFEVQLGARVCLNNKTKEAEAFLWYLELQYYKGYEVKGTTSALENPVCYLYNPGQNKIRLVATNQEGCTAEVTAENLYVKDAGHFRNAEMQSYFAETEEAMAPTKFFSVYPRKVDAAHPYITVLVSPGAYAYRLVDAAGRVCRDGRAEGSMLLYVADLPSGVYVLQVEDERIKIIK